MTRPRLTPEAHAASLRQSRQRAQRAKVAQLCIEGEHVTVAGIAERLGVSVTAAKDRLYRARKRPEPITWRGLGVGS